MCVLFAFVRVCVIYPSIRCQCARGVSFVVAAASRFRASRATSEIGGAVSTVRLIDRTPHLEQVFCAFSNACLLHALDTYSLYLSISALLFEVRSGRRARPRYRDHAGDKTDIEHTYVPAQLRHRCSNPVTVSRGSSAQHE